MSIGEPITQPIPPVGTSGTSYATQLVAFLTEVKTRLEAKVALTSLLAGVFDLSNNGLANASYLGMYDSTEVPTTPVGSFQRYNGDAYYVGPSGAVRITNGAGLSVTSAEGITGDYGTGPEELKYVLPDLEYYAYSDAGSSPKEWAYLAARSFDVYGSLNSTTRVRINWTPGASYTLTLPDAAPAAQRIVQMDDEGKLLNESAVVHNGTIELSTDNGFKVTGTGDYHHDDISYIYPIGATGIGVPTGTLSYVVDALGTNIHAWQLSGGGEAHVYVPRLRHGERLKSLSITATGSALATMTVYYNGAEVPTTQSGGFNLGEKTATLDTPLEVNRPVHIVVFAGGGGLSMRMLTVSVDNPAP